MELHPLPPMPLIAVQGQARAVSSPRPRTITEILQDARRSMELEDAYVAWLEGKPVPQLRHPRRTLRQWLTGRHPEPAPMTMMSDVIPVWRDTESRY